MRLGMLYDCARISIETTELKDGAPLENQWFDEPRDKLVSVSAKATSPGRRTR